ncbi:MAG: bifunctional hydroxymethylpyrimidine kinase/phosphomethylpyrimidine kinase [Thermodesulfobacteriota bacterium]|nr:bifunctional hydroxymethylpyrimidine kinase/phosphomethylpyrimidine kinase [Thermodesulfobacteriota bacterium]
MNKKDSNNQNTSRTYRKVLTIAGSDSGGGAGIQADLKTIAAMGCFGMSVITALTAQNTKGVTGIQPVPPDFAEKQMEAVFSDIGVDAVKIGMLYSAELIETVARVLKQYKIDKIVLDPVMVAQSGDKLLKDNAIEAIKKHLMPLSSVVTPNLPEASVLLDCKLHDFKDIKNGAKDLSEYGSRSVLIKGGHLEDNDSSDFLYLAKEDRFVVLKGKRIKTKNNHGTGCTLSSAIASCMAKGCGIEEAVRKAKAYINEAIRAGSKYKIGHGHGPVHHFHKFWE